MSFYQYQYKLPYISCHSKVFIKYNLLGSEMKQNCLNHHRYRNKKIASMGLEGGGMRIKIQTKESLCGGGVDGGECGGGGVGGGGVHGGG